MATLALEETNGARPAGPAAPMTAWQVWGLILIAPYLLVFLVFVLYPVAYGFWLARDPQTYVRLFDDPIFPRSVVNPLPFRTLILIAGRLAIPGEIYEAAAVDGAAKWQSFRYITWPSMQTLYLTCTIISMIWTLGDFNSVYLLTGGGPADLTHVLATLGIRYLRLDAVDLSMAAIVCALPLVLPLVFFMMKRLSK